MAGYLQKAKVRRNPPVGWQMQFAAITPWTRKVACIVCGAQGDPSSTVPHGWQAAHLLGHPEECASCGGRFVKSGLKQHLRCRSEHPACPDHLDTQYRRLLRATG